jgi:CheY-like chemotaxis protein
LHGYFGVKGILRQPIVPTLERPVPIVQVIDTGVVTRAVMAEMLKACGCSVVVVDNAADALEMFGRHWADIALVFVDARMAPTSDCTLLQELHRINTDVPTVILTDASAADWNHDARIAGTLRKRCDIDELSTLLDRLLSRGRPPIPVTSAPVPASLPASKPSSALRPTSAAAAVTRPAAAPPTAYGQPVPRRRSKELASFQWPPSAEDLAAIQVVDARTLTAIDIGDQPTKALVAHVASNASALAAAEPESLVPTVVEIQIPARRWSWRSGIRDLTLNRLTAAAVMTLCCLAFATFFEMSTRNVARQTADIRPLPAAPPAASDPPLAARVIVEVAQPRAVTGRAPQIASLRQDARAERDGPSSRPSIASRTSPANRASATGPLDPSSARRVTTLAVATPVPTADTPRPRAAESRRSPLSSTVPVMTVPAPDSASVANVPFSAAVSPEPSRSTSSATPASAPASSAPALSDTAEDRRIYAALEQYERGYDRLDAKAVGAVWPSLDTRALARAFGSLRQQELELAGCQVAVAAIDATAVCGGRATYVPRVGSQQPRTETREWTFRLRKVDQGWTIVKAEAR